MPEPKPEAFASRTAFFGDTMAFEQWVRFVLLPRVRQIIAEEGEFPESSSVGTRAMRELDGAPQAERLVSLLNEFDDIFNSEWDEKDERP